MRSLAARARLLLRMRIRSQMPAYDDLTILAAIEPLGKDAKPLRDLAVVVRDRVR